MALFSIVLGLQDNLEWSGKLTWIWKAFHEALHFIGEHISTNFFFFYQICFIFMLEIRHLKF